MQQYLFYFVIHTRIHEQCLLRRKTAMGSSVRIELFPPIGEIRDTACHVHGFPYNRGNQMKGFALLAAAIRLNGSSHGW